MGVLRGGGKGSLIFLNQSYPGKHPPKIKHFKKGGEGGKKRGKDWKRGGKEWGKWGESGGKEGKEGKEGKREDKRGKDINFLDIFITLRGEG